MISTRLAKVENIPDNFFTKEIEQKLWHIIILLQIKMSLRKR